MSSAASHEHAADPASANASARVAALFERHGRMVYGICRTMLRDLHEAEDATQQAFLSAHRALATGARVREPGAWLATIARNECRGRIAAGMRTPLPVADDDLAEVPHSADEVERRLQAGELRDALAELPERQREAVVLRYVHGLRYSEVAKALGLSRPATEALLFRARRTMRVRLRHAVGAALVVPLSIREELALALPGFETQAGSGTAAAGVAGGLLAKLASAPTAAKIATVTMTVSTVGAVGAVESDRSIGDGRAQAGAIEERSSTRSDLGTPGSDEAGEGDRRGHDDGDDVTTGGPRTSESRSGDDVRADGSARETSGARRGDERDGRDGPREAANGLEGSSGSGNGGENDDDGAGSSGSSSDADGETAETSGSSDSSSESASSGSPDDASAVEESEESDGGSSDGGTSGSGSSGSGSSGSSSGSGDGSSGDPGSGSNSGSSFGSGDEEHEES